MVSVHEVPDRVARALGGLAACADVSCRGAVTASAELQRGAGALHGAPPSSRRCSSSACARRCVMPTPTIAHYRKSSTRAGVRPEDLRSLADLARFPFTTKADLRAAYPFGFFAVPHGAGGAHACLLRHHRQAHGGGLYARSDIATWSDLVARSIRAAGGRRGMRVHVAYGYGLFTGGLGAHYGAEAAGCTVIPMSGGQTERQVQLIMRFRARHHHDHAELHARHPR